MKPRLLDYLACPDCGAAFRLAAREQEGEEIVSGDLACEGGHVFPVVRGVPRLVRAGTLAADVKETVSGFGYEWTHKDASTLRERDAEQFLDWVVPLTLDDFRGQVVLDAGCGMGRWAACAARAGAKDVVCVDLSDSVESAYANLRPFPNAHVVQGDLFRLPLRRAFDLAYSIGVLHHTPDPEGAFASVAGKVVPGGRIFAWVYGREGNGWIVWFVNPVRRHVTSRLPRGMLWGLSTLLTVPLHGAARLAYSREGRTRLVPLPYGAYLSWLARYDFAHTRAIVFDHLVPGLAYYIREADFRSWFTKRGMSEPVVTARNANSWRGLGRLPSSGT
jgi:SAM-dependent methyltransferase/uncharacterized protein YbaR (Trm112 family)